MYAQTEERLKIRQVMFVLRFYNDGQEILANDRMEIHPQYAEQNLTNTQKMIVVRAD